MTPSQHDRRNDARTSERERARESPTEHDQAHRPTPEREHAPLRVLFVCVENSNRSQMAEAFARMHANALAQAREGLCIEAFSAGSKPSGQVNPKAIESMRELGYDLSRHASKSLDELPDVQFDAAVTMGCGDACPNVRARVREDWNIPDPKSMPADEFRAVRDLIQAKVFALMSKLRAEAAPRRS